MAVPELVVLIAGPAGAGVEAVAAAVGRALPTFALAALLDPAAPAAPPAAGRPGCPPTGDLPYRPAEEGPAGYLDRAVFDAEGAPRDLAVWGTYDTLDRYDLYEALGERRAVGGLAVVRVNRNPLAAAAVSGAASAPALAAAWRRTEAAARRLAAVSDDRLDLDYPDHLSPAGRRRLAAFLDLPAVPPPPAPAAGRRGRVGDLFDHPELVGRRLPGECQALWRAAVREAAG